MKELFTQIFDAIGLAYWVEITTDNPRCTYYFGPFLFKSDAESEKAGYIEDLKSEGAKMASIKVKKCQPRNLTIFEESEETKPFKPIATSFGSIS